MNQHSSGMYRDIIPIRTKRFVRWAQKDKCLLCEFRLVEFHHIIPDEDGGPVHHLNLVALCPNHHKIVERGRRTNWTDVYSKYLVLGKPHDITYIKAKREFLAIVEMLKSFDNDDQELLISLMEPYTVSNAREWQVNQKEPAEIAEEILQADLSLLDTINRRRPRIFLSTPDELSEEHLYALDVSPRIQNELDEKASKFIINVQKKHFRDVAALHMFNLELPHEIIEALLLPLYT